MAFPITLVWEVTLCELDVRIVPKVRVLALRGEIEELRA